MRLLTVFLLITLPHGPLLADAPDVGSVAEAVLAIMESEAEHGDNPVPDDASSENPITPDYGATDAIATPCFNHDNCHSCILGALSVADDAYYALAKNHAWKKWVDTEYARMDALASAAAGLNKHAKMAYAFQKARVIIPAKKSYEDNVKAAQVTTLNSLKSAFMKVGSCEAEHLGQDSFTTLAMVVWQILKVKYVD